jgi:hypothetical protein
VSGLDNFPATLEIVHGQTKLHRENVDRAHRENAQRRIAAGDSVCYLIHGSIAASRNHAAETFLDGTSRERFRFTSMRTDADWPTSDNRFDSRLPVSNSFEISSGWIENDNHVSHARKELQTVMLIAQSREKHLWIDFHCRMRFKMDLRFFSRDCAINMTIGFGLCFKLRLRNI